MEVAGSCLALAGATVSVSFTITKLINEVADLREHLRLVHTELESLESILFLIADNVHKVTSDGAMVSKSLSGRLDDVIRNCRAAVQQTSELVGRFSDGGFRKGVEWVAVGKRDLDKTREHLRSRRMDLDVCLNMLNISLASGIRIGTMQILDQQAVIHDDVQGIMQGIQALQADWPKMEELLELLRSMAIHRTDNFLMDRFIDSLTSYAETVHDRSVFGYEHPHVLPDHMSAQLEEQDQDSHLDSTYGSEGAAATSSSIIGESLASVATGLTETVSSSLSQARRGILEPDSKAINYSTPSTDDQKAGRTSYAEHGGVLQQFSLKEKKSPSPPSLASEAPTASHDDPQLELHCRLRMIIKETSTQDVRFLLAQGADPNRTLTASEIKKHVSQAWVSDTKLLKDLPLANAVRSNNVACIQVLLDHGADPCSKKSLPVIFDAISAGAIDLIRQLAKHGADVNTVWHSPDRDSTSTGNSNWISPLSAALWCAPGKPLQAAFALVRTLLEVGADPNGRHQPGQADQPTMAKTGENHTPASVKSHCSFPPLAQCITIADAALAKQKRHPTSTRITAAGVHRTMSHIALLLIRRGADRNSCWHGDAKHVRNHPLVLALRYRNVAMLGVLVMQGAVLPRIGTDIGRYQALGEDSSSDCPSASSITSLVCLAAIADGRRSKVSWLTGLISKQPFLGTLCLLDTVGALSSSSNLPPGLPPQPEGNSTQRWAPSSNETKQTILNLTDHIPFLLAVLIDSGADAKHHQGSVQYLGRRRSKSWLKSLGRGKSRPGSPKEAVLTPLELADEIWLGSDSAIPRIALRQILLGVLQGDGQGENGSNKGQGFVGTSGASNTVSNQRSRLIPRLAPRTSSSFSVASGSNTSSRAAGVRDVDQPVAGTGA